MDSLQVFNAGQHGLYSPLLMVSAPMLLTIDGASA